MDKYFKPMDDLVDPQKKDSSKMGVDYFHVVGDLDGSKVELGDAPGKSEFRPMDDLIDTGKKESPKTETSYFHIAGDLTPSSTVEEMTDYFRPAGDLNEEIIIKKNNEKNKFNLMKNKEDINDYLLTVVSGKKYPSVCELGVLMSSGRMIISFNELKKMVDEGYNIVSANVINAERDMIEVEFQGYVYDEELMEKRRRF